MDPTIEHISRFTKLARGLRPRCDVDTASEKRVSKSFARLVISLRAKVTGTINAHEFRSCQLSHRLPWLDWASYRSGKRQPSWLAKTITARTSQPPWLAKTITARTSQPPWLAKTNAERYSAAVDTSVRLFSLAGEEIGEVVAREAKLLTRHLVAVFACFWLVAMFFLKKLLRN